MPDFKIGERVLILGHAVGSLRNHVGQIGTITEENQLRHGETRGIYTIRVNGDRCRAYDTELERVLPEKACGFNVGDVVRVVRSNPYSELEQGHVGRIVLMRNGLYALSGEQVALYFWHAADELEFYEAPEYQPDELVCVVKSWPIDKGTAFREGAVLRVVNTRKTNGRVHAVTLDGHRSRWFDPWSLEKVSTEERTVTMLPGESRILIDGVLFRLERQ